MNLLWLASWYPNRTDPSTGDFIERQARAVAPFVDNLFVVGVFKDPRMPAGTREIIRSTSGNLHTCIAYYGPGNWGGLLEPLHSYRTYLRLQESLFREISTEHGAPPLIHVHVAMKAGWFARKMKKMRGIRYVVTEHWTGYLPGAVPSLRDMGRIYRMMNNNVLQHASMLIPVSKNLGECLSATGISVPQQVIPNVVDTALFRFEPATAGRFRFVHFSYLNRQKNPEGILQACAILQSRGLDFECRLMGAASPELEKQITKMGLASVVSVLPEMPHEEVAVAMRSAQALVMFSRFENLPCVVLEALCSGLPVVSSNVGGLSEVINESNGLLVPEGDVEALAAAMESVLNDYARFNRRGIAESAAALFNTKRIGEAHLAIYRKLAGL